MDANNWIALVGIGITLQTIILGLAVRVAIVLTNLQRDVKDLRENHVDHMEDDIRAMKRKLFGEA